MRPCERNWKRHEEGQFREIEPMIDDQYGIRCEARVEASGMRCRVKYLAVR